MSKRTRLPGLFVLAILLLSDLAWAQKLDSSLFVNMAPRSIGPAGMSGRVTAIDVVEKNPDVIYIGSASGGVWKSENGGFNWNPVFDNQPSASIGDIAIYQKNPSILYVGTGEGNPRNSQNSGRGMFKSMDAGRTWKHIGLENTRQIHRVLVHPDNPDIVWAGVQGSAWGPHPERGVFRSTDGGKTWERTLYVNDSTGIADLRMDPSNPNKLIAAMWEFRRWPWYFKSGGEGSGIYISEDGGITWGKSDCKSGLPCGELGRIGIAFSPSKPKVVYAYIESKNNAIYRSQDGGYSWEKRSETGDENIGGRPFYYADLYVDVMNENRVYSIATEVTVSEDGGATWEVFAAGNRIHTDHHAWWAHPTNPDHIINGNDGGLYFTHDRGENWLFVENLPLGQFYHIRVDNEIPYNVYGGLQDNGSWYGPAYTWFKGDIRNLDWQRIGVGDGFDVVPDPLNSDYGYAMAQSGGLLRYHKPSGQLLSIKPVHPDGKYLRFNWNAAIAIDPIDKKTIYYGSQYVHKSTDYGQSWEIISPDLTTNDTLKQDFLESGGLTYDVTGAEFHTSIIAIAPSPLDQNTLWVGTDDGNVQLTTDGGGSWTLVHGDALQDSSRLKDSVRFKGMPEAPTSGWVSHIHPSNHSADEAFIVIDDHRQNNHEPYVYRTTDSGFSWERVVDSSDVGAFAYTFIQDAEAPDLWFCGTDDGLYFTIDGGENWNRWQAGFPRVPTMDMTIQSRESDLVLGTFGRSVWILDDIEPLRALSLDGNNRILSSRLYAFQPNQAILAAVGESRGYRDGKVGDFLYSGENKPYGAVISFFADPGDDGADTINVTIRNSRGQVVRSLKTEVASRGIHRLHWDLSRNAPRKPNIEKPDSTVYYAGIKVRPGEYQVNFRSGQLMNSTAVYVLPDPRLSLTGLDFARKDTLIAEYYRLVSLMTQIGDEIRGMESDVEWLESRAEEQGISLDDERYKTFKSGLENMKAKLLGKDAQGIYRQPDVIIRILSDLGRSMDILHPVSQNQLVKLEYAKNACASFSLDWDEFVLSHVKPVKTMMAEKGITLF